MKPKRLELIHAQNFAGNPIHGQQNVNVDLGKAKSRCLFVTGNARAGKSTVINAAKATLPGCMSLADAKDIAKGKPFETTLCFEGGLSITRSLDPNAAKGQRVDKTEIVPEGTQLPPSFPIFDLGTFDKGTTDRDRLSYLLAQCPIKGYDKGRFRSEAERTMKEHPEATVALDDLFKGWTGAMNAVDGSNAVLSAIADSRKVWNSRAKDHTATQRTGAEAAVTNLETLPICRPSTMIKAEIEARQKLDGFFEIEKRNAALAEKRKAMEAKKAEIGQARLILESELANLPDAVDIEPIRQQVNEWMVELVGISGRQATAEANLKRLAEFQALYKASGGVCPTCAQEWQMDAKALNTFREEWASTKRTILECEADDARLDQEIKEQNARLDMARQNDINRQAIQRKIDLLPNVDDALANFPSPEPIPNEAEVEALRREHMDLTVQKEDLEKEHTTALNVEALKKAATITQNNSKIEAEIAALNVEALKALESALGPKTGLQGAMIKESIVPLVEKANEIMTSIGTDDRLAVNIDVGSGKCDLGLEGNPYYALLSGTEQALCGIVFAAALSMMQEAPISFLILDEVQTILNEDDAYGLIKTLTAIQEHFSAVILAGGNLSHRSQTYMQQNDWTVLELGYHHWFKSAQGTPAPVARKGRR